MILRYEDGKRVQIGDKVELHNGGTGTVTRMEEPHKPSSTGRVYVAIEGATYTRSFFPGVINATWSK